MFVVHLLQRASLFRVGLVPTERCEVHYLASQCQRVRLLRPLVQGRPPGHQAQNAKSLNEYPVTQIMMLLTRPDFKRVFRKRSFNFFLRLKHSSANFVSAKSKTARLLDICAFTNRISPG